ncbi:uncharacterized protein LOC135812699 [Sycon ciliatum]|uniref:uncharacterized protein LOC135812699 n=1 Tax=Sycon ciliatum TaxID=27933 RepID=UPI0031F6FE1B
MASCGSRARAPPALTVTLVLLLGLAVVLPSCHTASIDMPNVPGYPAEYDSEHAIIDAATSAFSCEEGYYERCASPPCAGGVERTPASAGLVDGRLTWTNLPTCEEMGTFTCGASTYLHGDNRTTLSSARQSCLNANSTLLNHLFLASLSGEERGCVLDRANPNWNVDANGRRYAFDRDHDDFTIPQGDGAVFAFVCLPTNYKSLMASSAPDVDTRSEVLRCRGLPEVYSCEHEDTTFVSMPGYVEFHLCLPQCSNQAPLPPTQELAFGEFSVTFNKYEHGVTAPVARSECKRQGRQLLHVKDLNAFKFHLFFAIKLKFSSLEDIWVVNSGRRIAKYYIQRRYIVNEELHSRSFAHGFICTKDVSANRCIGQNRCPENHQCIHKGKGFACKGTRRCDGEALCPVPFENCLNTTRGFECRKASITPGPIRETLDYIANLG